MMHPTKVPTRVEPHTRWISKGKAGRPVELGVPVCIVEDQFRFILHSEIMWQGSDADFAAPMVEITRKLFPDFRAASFGRGFHSPENRATLDEPKFSSWSKTELWQVVDVEPMPVFGKFYLNSAVGERQYSGKLLMLSQ